jgi:hypothetical protein
MKSLIVTRYDRRCVQFERRTTQPPANSSPPLAGSLGTWFFHIAFQGGGENRMTPQERKDWPWIISALGLVVAGVCIALMYRLLA